MDNLAQILREEVNWYEASGEGAGLRLFAVNDEERKIYAVNAIHLPRERHTSGIVVLARIVDDKIVIEEDRTDRPLVKHLMERGIPREKIILAFAGETVPEPAS